MRITKISAVALLAVGISVSHGSDASAQQNDEDKYYPPSPAINLDLIQQAWQGRPKKGTQQKSPGYRQLVHSWDTVHALNLRPGFITSLRFDPSETVRRALLADTTGFETAVAPNVPNVVLIRPLLTGVDTNLTVFFTSGAIYPFYLASHPTDHNVTTDVIVDVLKGEVEPNDLSPYKADGPHPSPDTGDLQAVLSQQQGELGTITNQPKQRTYSRILGNLGDGQNRQQTATEEFVNSVPIYQLGSSGTSLNQAGSTAEERFWGNLPNYDFDIENFEYNYDVFASDQEAAEAIGPERVFHDGRSTIIDFGKDYSRRVLPAPAMLVSDTEQPASFRVLGDGRYLVVNQVGDIILRDARHVICLILRKPVVSAQANIRLLGQETASPQSNEVLQPNLTIADPPVVVPAPTAQNPKPVVFEPPELPDRYSVTIKNLEESSIQELLQNATYGEVQAHPQDPKLFRVMGYLGNVTQLCQEVLARDGRCSARKE